jgi:hypothetical protein
MACIYTVTDSIFRWSPVQFDHEDDVCFIAMCYPFTYSDLSILLLEVEHLAQKRRIITRRELCKTEGGVACEILTICNPRPPSQVERRPVFFISGRVHPGESNASYIVKGILQFLVSDEEIARELCEHFVFEVIPMLNPDGVIHGHYRVSLVFSLVAFYCRITSLAGLHFTPHACAQTEEMIPLRKIERDPD